MTADRLICIVHPEVIDLSQAFDCFVDAFYSSDGLHTDYTRMVLSAKKSLSDKREAALPVRLGEYEFEFAHVPKFHLSWISVQGKDAGSAHEELVSHLHRRHALIMGVALNREYDFWQNAYDPLQYRAAGRSYAGLKMKSNNLPPPLTQQVIDTTCNPGRRCFKRGFMEAVGEVLWLTESFCQATQANVSRLADDPGFMISELAPGLLRVKLLATGTDLMGIEKLFAKLRTALYPI